MNAKLLISTVAAGVLSAAIAGPAAAVSMVAGWDFSQYSTDGFLSLDEVNLVNTLTSNYSDLDPTFGAGVESAAFGTMHLDGQFGSTNTPLDFADPFVPSAAAGGSLLSNKTTPAGSDFDSFTILLNEGGQTFANPFAMAAVAAATVVFAADLTSVVEVGSNWVVSFGARTFSGTSTIGVEFSTDGVSFNPLAPVNLTSVDTLFSINLGGTETERAFVRFSFDPANGQPFIDNVALSADLTVPAPEPTTAVLLLAGLLGLARIGRRRA
jgi:hypothetical protein